MISAGVRAGSEVLIDVRLHVKVAVIPTKVVGKRIYQYVHEIMRQSI